MASYATKEINEFDENKFVEIFGNVVEHYLPCAFYLHQRRPYSNVEELIKSAKEFLDNQSIQDQETILKLHPDLSGKIYQNKFLTCESKKEQSSAGLDYISVKDAEELNSLNQKYKAKFGFPFVICARENKFTSILNGLKQRMNNSKDEEIKLAIAEVKKITMYRILSIVQGKECTN